MWGHRVVALKVPRWHPAADEGKELLRGCACFLLAVFVRPQVQVKVLVRERTSAVALV